MKLHIIVDLNECETKIYTAEDAAKAYVVGKCTDARGGEAVWEALQGEYLLEESFIYSTAEFPFTAEIVREMKDTLAQVMKAPEDDEENAPVVPTRRVQ